ncbi:MAG: response regulator [Endomicrobium sp.]|jgi:YesN/AraC family two-component response regulator|nr:response regulator [Endomicrobium sp.]
MSISKGRILIVDDEQAIRELLITEFFKLGYEVFSAINGEEAIAKIKTEKVNIVITDMKMPKVDGLDLLKVVKEQFPETEVIIITGYATIENALDAMRSGAYDFVQKPFNIDELLALADKAMEKSELKILVALYESSSAVFSSLKLEELFPVMISLVKDVTDSKDASIFLVDNNEQLYLAYSSIAMFDFRIRELETLVSKIFSDKAKCIEPMFFNVDNLPNGLEKVFCEKTETKSILVYSIILHNKMIGCLVLTKNVSSFVASDLKNVSIFVAQIAQSITNTKLYEKLEIKVAELEQALAELDKAKKEICYLKEDTE